MIQGQYTQINLFPYTTKEKSGNKILKKAILTYRDRKRISGCLGWLESIRIDYKAAREDFVRWQKCSIFWLWWGLHQCTHLLKLIKAYSQSGYILLSVNFCASKVEDLKS